MLLRDEVGFDTEDQAWPKERERLQKAREERRQADKQFSFFNLFEGQGKASALVTWLQAQTALAGKQASISLF